MKSAMLERGRETTGGGSVMAWWDKSRTFLAQVKNEIERVTWPSWKEVQATTLVVIMTSVMFGVYLWGIDMILNTATVALFRAFAAS